MSIASLLSRSCLIMLIPFLLVACEKSDDDSHDDPSATPSPSTNTYLNPLADPMAALKTGVLRPEIAPAFITGMQLVMKAAIAKSSSGYVATCGYKTNVTFTYTSQRLSSAKTVVMPIDSDVADRTTTQSYEYNDAGLLSKETNVAEFGENSVSSNLTMVSTYTYAADQSILKSETKVTEGTGTNVVYDAFIFENNLLKSFRTNESVETVITYNDSSLPVTLSSGEQTQTFTYDSQGRLVEIDPEFIGTSVSASFDYDADGMLSKIGSQELTYDSEGRPWKVDDCGEFSY